MKQILQVITVFSLVACMMACKKDNGGGSGGGTTPPPTEANLVIALDPAPGTGVVAALSASYAFKVLISSTPPANGVKIDITGTKDSDNSTAFTQTSQTNTSTINSIDQQLNNLVAGVLYTVKVTVTSQNSPGNSASVTFKVARK